MGLVNALWWAEKLHGSTFAAILLAAGYYGGALGARMLAPRSRCAPRYAVSPGLLIAVSAVATGLVVELIARGHRLDVGYIIVFFWTLPLLLLLEYWPVPLLCVFGSVVLCHLSERFY